MIISFLSARAMAFLSKDGRVSIPNSEWYSLIYDFSNWKEAIFGSLHAMIAEDTISIRDSASKKEKDI